jgi:phage terminase small subunit
MDRRHVAFVEEYLVGLNAQKAYQPAYDSEMRANVARSCASRLLTTASVQKLLSVRVKAMFERSEGLQDRMLDQQFALAFAGPNELVEHRREAYRYCDGNDHLY